MSGINLLERPVNDNESIEYQTSYFAYLQIFDANNRRERKDLLKKVLLNPYVSYLFTYNCTPNDNELDLAFNSIVNDPKSCFLFLKNANFGEKYRPQVINTILDDFSYSYKAVQECNLNTEERKMIFDKYRPNLVQADSFDNYFQYCTTFHDLIDEQDMNKLVNQVYEKQDQKMIQKVLNSNVPLTEDMRDKLESVLVISSLGAKY